MHSSLVRRHVRGRPKQLLETTILGEQYVNDYRQLANLRLFSNDNDVKKALLQADLAAKLDEQKLSTYARFQEINQLARNVAHAAQAKQSPE